jgi:uncharacterized membrane protein (DUF485 family)
MYSCGTPEVLNSEKSQGFIEELSKKNGFIKVLFPSFLLTVYFIFVKIILFGFRESMVDNVNDIITKEKIIPDKKSNKKDEDA